MPLICLLSSVLVSIFLPFAYKSMFYLDEFIKVSSKAKNCIPDKIHRLWIKYQNKLVVPKKHPGSEDE